MASRPAHCSKDCPFWEKCEAGARVMEHSLTACSCFVACAFWSKRLRRVASWTAELRNVINLTLAVHYWRHKNPEFWKGCSSLFVPVAVLAHWWKHPFAEYAKYMGGCCQLMEHRDELGEQIHDLLETPLELFMPPLLRLTIGIGTGLYALT